MEDDVIRPLKWEESTLYKIGQEREALLRVARAAKALSKEWSAYDWVHSDAEPKRDALQVALKEVEHLLEVE